MEWVYEHKPGNRGCVRYGDIIMIRCCVHICTECEHNITNNNCRNCVDRNLAEIVQEPGYKETMKGLELSIGKRQLHDKFEKGLLNMMVGSIRRIRLDPKDAFEDVGVFDYFYKEYFVEPNTTLCFDVHLINIK